MHPEILTLATRYIQIPKQLVEAFKAHQTPDLYIPEDGIEIDLRPLKNLTRKTAKLVR